MLNKNDCLPAYVLCILQLQNSVPLFNQRHYGTHTYLFLGDLVRRSTVAGAIKKCIEICDESLKNKKCLTKFGTGSKSFSIFHVLLYHM